MDTKDTRNRLKEANKFLVEETTSAEKLESLSIILKGLNPKLDQALQNCAENFSKIEKLQSGDVISLTADSLPENSEEEKKRKKAILAFIRSWEDLKSEVERIKSEFEDSKNPTQQAQGVGRIIAFAKGPLGIITVIAAAIVGTLILLNSNQGSKTKSTTLAQTPTPASDSASPSPTPTTATSPSPQAKKKVKVIIFNGKKIPLEELKIGSGPECSDHEGQAPHYHALNQIAARALDGTLVADPGGCGYGKTKEVAVVEE